MFAVLTILIEFLVLVGLNTLKGTAPSDEAVLIFILVFTVSYIFTLDKSEKLKNVKMPLLCGYAIRLVLTLWEIYGRDIWRIPYSAGDAGQFYKTAVAYAQGQEIGFGVPFTTIMGGIFSYTGISRLLGQFLVMLFSVAAIHMTALILNQMGIDKETQRKSMWILCLLPNFIFLSCAFLRESIIIMCITISLFCFIRWFLTNNMLFFAVAFIFVFFGARFHAGVVGLAVGYIVVRMLYDGKRRRMKISVQGTVIAALFLIAFVFLYNNYSDKLFGKVAGVESLADIAQSNFRGGSDYSAYVGNSNNLLNLIIYTPIRIVYFLFSPFPWQWRDLTDIIAFIFSSVFYMWVLIRAFRYLQHPNSKHKQFVTALLLLIICSVFVFAWGVSNTGTAMRHRDKMIVLYLILYSVTNSTVSETSAKKLMMEI